jgi:hypothetical protein
MRTQNNSSLIARFSMFCVAIYNRPSQLRRNRGISLTSRRRIGMDGVRRNALRNSMLSGKGFVSEEDIC